MPTKRCMNCGNECGPRTKVCKCGTSFDKKPIVVEETPKQEVHDEQKIAPKSSYSGRVICTPSEACPYSPEGYRVAGWENPASDKVVLEWARKVKNYGKDVAYSVDAVIYWARSYWDVHSTDWYRIRGLIYSAFEPSETMH